MPVKSTLAHSGFVRCHFDRKNLRKQILEWRNLAYTTLTRFSPLRSFLATVEMTQNYIALAQTLNMSQVLICYAADNAIWNELIEKHRSQLTVM
jgi:hypothetical protein